MSVTATNTTVGSGEGEMGNKFDSTSLGHSETINGDKDGNQRFALLTSPLLPNERNVWEFATDAMLQDIYSSSNDGGSAGSEEMAAPLSVVSGTDSTDVSAGSSPFDLVDLDIEIEEPLQLDIGLDKMHNKHEVAAAVAVNEDWPSLFSAGLVA